MVRSRNSQESSGEDFRDQSKKKVAEHYPAEELSGKMRKDFRDDKLAHTLLEVDREKIDRARMLSDALNNNITSFTPDLALEHLVNNYRTAKKLFGETLIRELTGYDPDYIEKNANVPEFKRELKERIKQNLDRLEEEGLLNKEGAITELGYEFSALSLLSEELDRLEGKGLIGSKKSKRKEIYGERSDYRDYHHGDRYKDLALKQTIKKSIRRGHDDVLKEDLVINQREAKGKITIIYAIDSSGSMKGEKIKVAKRAGIALAYKALQNKDEAGIVVFGSKIVKDIPPTHDFQTLLFELSKIRTSGETDISLALEHSINLLTKTKNTKHIVLLTDALQTKGKNPEKEVLEKVSITADMGISISVIGISLDRRGESLAKKIADVSRGSLYKVISLDEIDSIIIEDYYKTKGI